MRTLRGGNRALQRADDEHGLLQAICRVIVEAAGHAAALEGEEYESRPFGGFDLSGKELARYLADALDPPFARFPGKGRMVVVMPDAQAAALPWAQAELDGIRDLFHAAVPLRPAARADVDRLLAASDVQLVHFSGHGEIGANADLSSLVLEAGTAISAMAFAATTLGSEAQPVLYLNACSVGRAGRVLSRAGGFAGNCIEAGWSGIIAPYWPVYDSAAAAFGVAFYAKVKAGCTIGEALQELRADSPDDPTAQSYAWFGDPFARLGIL